VFVRFVPNPARNPPMVPMRRMHTLNLPVGGHNVALGGGGGPWRWMSFSAVQVRGCGGCSLGPRTSKTLFFDSTTVALGAGLSPAPRLNIVGFQASEIFQSNFTLGSVPFQSGRSCSR